MKTIVLSDTHLSSRTYPKKYQYLKSVIEEADNVVIAGDFWDGFLTSFDKFIQSDWQSLFPLLLEKQAIYLYGNHDRPEWCDERVALFSVEQGMNTSLDIGGQTYHITHGHTVFTSLEDRIPALNRSVPLRIGSSVDVLHKLIWGKQFLKKDSNINLPMAEWVVSNLPEQEVLITGHSHYPEIDLSRRFINSGFIGIGYGSYISLGSDGPRVVRARY